MVFMTYQKNLAEAVEELKNNPLILDALGDHISRSFIEAKEIEIATYISQVTDWEINQYLRAY